MSDQEIQPLLSIVDRLRLDRSHVVVGMDGRSGTGKSTLSQRLAERVQGAYVDQDDFYSGGDLMFWKGLSPRIRADRCIDWRRVRREALEPLRAGSSAQYRPFDWETMVGNELPATIVGPAEIVILDGAYSTRNEFADLIDLRVLVTLDDNERRTRLKTREGNDWTADWFKVRDDAEDYYFDVLRPEAAFDLVIRRLP